MIGKELPMDYRLTIKLSLINEALKDLIAVK